MFVFPHTFPLLCKFTFPIFRQLYGFLLHPKYLRNPWSWKACVFLCFSCSIEIHFSYVWGVGWISVSPILFEKPITFKCLFFPILFSFNENSLFPCFGNCTDFCFTRNVEETQKFEILRYSAPFYLASNRNPYNSESMGKLNCHCKGNGRENKNISSFWVSWTFRVKQKSI